MSWVNRYQFAGRWDFVSAGVPEQFPAKLLMYWIVLFDVWVWSSDVFAESLDSYRY